MVNVYVCVYVYIYICVYIYIYIWFVCEVATNKCEIVYHCEKVSHSYSAGHAVHGTIFVNMIAFTVACIYNTSYYTCYYIT